MTITIIEVPSKDLKVSDYKFVSVYDCDFRTEIKTMADTITDLDLWKWFRTVDPPKDKGYSWWEHTNIELISKTLPNNPHSGATFAYCMRQMQSIAKNGFTKWNSS